MGDVSPLKAAPNRRCQACPIGPPLRGPQLTLTEVTHSVEPRSGSLETLGHSTLDNNMRDIISNGISDSPFVLTQSSWMLYYNKITVSCKTLIQQVNSMKTQIRLTL